MSVSPNSYLNCKNAGTTAGFVEPDFLNWKAELSTKSAYCCFRTTPTSKADGNKRGNGMKRYTVETFKKFKREKKFKN
jgi:hypothetical protein